MTLLEELKSREILSNVTNENNLEKAIQNKGYFYLGIDPTGDCLHLGHYQNIVLIKLLMKYGLKPIILVGGATGIIGDPSGRVSERQLLDEKILDHNVKSLIKQIQSLVNSKVEVINNYEWFKDMNSLMFLKNIGKQININYMLAKDSVKDRIESGLSFTEFSYMLLQSYDFLHLYKTKKVVMQLGGSDQWGNITSGLELIRKNFGTDHKAVGLTTQLIVDKQGNKFGKSQGKPIWLEKEKTSPYEIYQFFLNLDDDMVINLLKRLSTLDIKIIDEIISKHNETKYLRYAQKMLSKNVIENLHGKEYYDEAVKISEAIFNNEVNILSKEQFVLATSGLKVFEISKESTILEIMEESKFTSSRRETREFLSNNAFRLNGKKIIDENIKLNKSNALHNTFFLIQLGKKKAFIIKIK